MIEQLRQKISPEVKEAEVLATHVTYRIGGPADYFFAAKTAEEAVKAVQAAKELGVPYYVLGGGSNVLVADHGFRGLVIKMVNRGIEINGTEVVAQAGTPSALVALQTTEAGLTGFEWAIGLPGTIGGAVRGNAGMYGSTTGDSVQQVYCLRNGEPEQLTREQCQFAYRNSLFKQQSGGVILTVTLQLSSAEQPATAQERLQEILRRKKETQPVEYPTAGCIFKNWRPANDEELQSLRQSLDLNPDEQIVVSADGTVPAGWIIDRAQLKGTKVGGASISEKHANFFINEDQAQANDIIGLIAVVKTRVRNMTSSTVNLQEEVEYVGF